MMGATCKLNIAGVQARLSREYLCRFRRATAAVVVFLAMAPVGITSSLAQKSALEQCTGAQRSEDRIGLCSAAIQAEQGQRAALAYNFRAVAYHDRYDLDRALADYGESTRLNPKSANAFNNRGIAWQAKGDLARAIADHTEAIRLDPQDNSGAYRFRSIAFRLKGELQRAISDAGEAIRLYPDYNAAYVARGLAYEDLGDLAQARADYAAALSMPPTYPSGPQAHREARDRLDALDRARSLRTKADTSSPSLRNRVALVIGNSDYAFTSKLTNPLNDATDFAVALRNLGFDVVEGKNLNRKQLGLALESFRRKLKDADLATFFYAGHGMQVAGKNYLVPVDARIQQGRDVAAEILDVATIIGEMEGAQRVNLIFLDACRDNPLARSVSAQFLAAASGLASTKSAVGTMIVYATQPDNVALDGEGRNSPFTTALLRHINSPNLEIGAMMRRVRAEVVAITREKQVPWEHSSLVSDVVLRQSR